MDQAGNRLGGTYEAWKKANKKGKRVLCKLQVEPGQLAESERDKGVCGVCKQGIGEG